MTKPISYHPCAACQEPVAGRYYYCLQCRPGANLYKMTVSNVASGFNRKYKKAPVIVFSLEELCAWRTSTPQNCHYCGIAEADIPKVNMKSQVQRNVKNMGMDRVDSSGDYEISNIVPCCFVCNQIKGDRFSEEEMKPIGQSIALVWQARIEQYNLAMGEQEAILPVDE